MFAGMRATSAHSIGAHEAYKLDNGVCGLFNFLVFTPAGLPGAVATS